MAEEHVLILSVNEDGPPTPAHLRRAAQIRLDKYVRPPLYTYAARPPLHTACPPTPHLRRAAHINLDKYVRIRHTGRWTDIRTGHAWAYSRTQGLMYSRTQGPMGIVTHTETDALTGRTWAC